MVIDIFKVEVPLEQSMCDNCKKESQEYYQLKTQIRFKFYTIEEIDILSKKILKEVNSLCEINNIFIIKDSIDLFIKHHSQIYKILHYFKENYICLEKKSKKLTGRDNLTSKDSYRYFLSIIILNLKKGSQIIYKGKEYKIYNVEKNTIQIKNIETGKKEKILLSKSIGQIKIR